MRPVYERGKAPALKVRDFVPDRVQRKLEQIVELAEVRRLESRRLVKSDVDRLLATMGLLG